jgi:hypothetical protein
MAAGNRDEQRQLRETSSPRAGTAAGDGPEGWDSLKEDVSEVAGVAVEKGRDLLGSTLGAARQQATSYVDQRKDEVAESISDFARSLREACAQFDDRPNIRALVDSAAESIDGVADSIRARSFNEIFDQAEYMIRRRPGTVAAATLAAGFLLARFIKASAENIREQEAERRRTASKRPRGQGQRARAQAAPGSSYAGA